MDSNLFYLPWGYLQRITIIGVQSFLTEFSENQVESWVGQDELLGRNYQLLLSMPLK